MTSPKIAATTTSVTTLRVVLVPLTVMSASNHAATASAQRGHRFLQPHQPEPQLLDLRCTQVALIRPADRLPLHQLADQLDDRQYQLQQLTFDRVRVTLRRN